MSTQSVYPNPGSNFLNVPLEKPDFTILQINFFDLEGNEVVNANHFKMQNNNVILDVSELKSIPYLIKIVTDKEVKQFKWQKE